MYCILITKGKHLLQTEPGCENENKRFSFEINAGQEWRRFNRHMERYSIRIQSVFVGNGCAEVLS